MKSPPLQTPLPPPSQIHKLISSQHDPLLALEIFNLSTSTHPTLRHPPSTFHSLIIKLARHRHFSLMHNLLSLLHSQNHPVPPSLLSHLLRIYARFDLPKQALTTFHTSVLRLNAKPLPRHLNLLLQLLASRRHLLLPAFDLFKSAQDRYCVTPNTKSYNILMRAFCLNGDLSVAYSLFNQMPKRDVVPDVESYKILMQGLCRNSQVNRAVDLLGDMLNKGFVPDTLSYTTLLNSLCRKKKLKEAYKLLCRMKVKGCNPDIVHYNTVIVGFCREGRAFDACKVLEDMPSNGCLPNLVSYRSLVAGLCRQGLYDEAENYVKEMMSKGFSPHFSVFHAMIKGFCNVGKVEEACGLLGTMLNLGESPHVDTWMEIIPRICEVDEMVRMRSVLEEILKVEVTPHTRIVEAGAGLEEYLIRRIRHSNRAVRAGYGELFRIRLPGGGATYDAFPGGRRVITLFCYLGIFFQGDGNSQTLGTSHLSSSLGNSLNSIPGAGRSNLVPVSGDASNTILNSGGPHLHRSASINGESYMRLPASPLSFSSNNITSGSSVMDGSSVVQQSSNHDPNSQQIPQPQQGNPSATSLPTSRMGQVSLPGGPLFHPGSFSQDPNNAEKTTIGYQAGRCHATAGFPTSAAETGLHAVAKPQSSIEKPQSVSSFDSAVEAEAPAATVSAVYATNAASPPTPTAAATTAAVETTGNATYANAIACWRKFVTEYYSPGAKKRWCLSRYDNVGHHSLGVFPQVNMVSFFFSNL
ncbi:hypothetical protein RHGRI_001889 [Rhododendron griersonianum]|uniref:Pentatricopeptide repeat-containing protein n=1 Tax=Rhododendron griersonianum TaxID=479676 RepID=A0AAV6LMV0_9ERIC|nr:hypothetical protein RHGRI_001889 [Rhododendron griersonianum]